MTPHIPAPSPGVKVERQLWGSTLVFTALCLASRLGLTSDTGALARFGERYEHSAQFLYATGWIGPTAALLLCLWHRRVPWRGGIVPVAVHGVLGLYWAFG
ncbi:hypothetical protein WN990_10215 [Kitasatospora purpeofusca]|uniref:hypothetical protein n=1 Tax=Kitasatospora purpeofusca TaxID=67352 RepID=UPI0030F0D8FC